MCYDIEINEMSLITDIRGSEELDMEKLRLFIEEKCTKDLVPVKINYLGTN